MSYKRCIKKKLNYARILELNENMERKTAKLLTTLFYVSFLYYIHFIWIIICLVSSLNTSTHTPITHEAI